MKNYKTYFFALSIAAFGMTSCKNDAQKDSKSTTQNWTFETKIALDSFGIIGIAKAEDGNLWLSDADNNRLIKFDLKTKKVSETLNDFDRPMHISTRDGALFVAEYGADQITKIQNGKREKLAFSDAFDASSGVDTEGGKTAVADFYNHRIVFTEGDKSLIIGKKGGGIGELTYPTDVQFANGKLYVADAYNHRVQVFDPSGKPLKTFGEAEKMNAATGIYVTDKDVFVTDFENSRILVYDTEGVLKQILTDNLDKPTDVLVIDNQLFIVNYHGRFISVFKQN